MLKRALPPSSWSSCVAGSLYYIESGIFPYKDYPIGSHVTSAVKTSSAKGSYIIVVYWQIKFFDQIPIFLKHMLLPFAGKKLSVDDKNMHIMSK